MVRINNSSDQGTRLLRFLQIACLLALLLYFGRPLLVPLFFGLLVAMVTYPFCTWLERRMPRSMAILICLTAVAALFAGLCLLLAWQISLFRQDLPGLLAKLRPAIPKLQEWVFARTTLTIPMQEEWLRQATMRLSGNAGMLLQGTAGVLFSLLLIPIYAALFLYHRGTFVRFLHKVMGERFRQETDLVLKETVLTYSGYIKGMVLVYIIVGILNSIGLLALGIRHAILFGMLTAIMTIIPYIGIIVSASLPIAVAFITRDSLWYPVGVVAVFTFVQYLEANVIFPKVVGKQLNISTWAMLVAIMAGGIIWGVSGMVLFIPFAAILKIASDHLESLEAVHILLSRDED